MKYQETKGAILILVLWIILAIGLLALSFSAAIRTEVNAARNVVDQKQSYYMARAGIDFTIYKLIEFQTAFAQIQQQQDQGIGTIPEVLLGSVNLSLGNGGAEVQIIDETGKINLNLAPGHLIYNLLIMVGIDPEEAGIITDSIEDWRDPDDLYRPNGAESDYYQSLSDPYLAKNGPLDVPEELLLVRGVTVEYYYGRKGVMQTGERVEFYGLQNYFTTFTALNRINVNSAPIPVLAAIPGLDYEPALQIDALRQGAPITNPAEIIERIPGIPTEVLGFLSTQRSKVFTLLSRGKMKGSDATTRIRCVAEVDMTKTKGYSVLYWNEADIEL